MEPELPMDLRILEELLMPGEMRPGLLTEFGTQLNLFMNDLLIRNWIYETDIYCTDIYRQKT